MAQPTWIETLHKKRDVLTSTIVVVETNDDQRVRELIDYEETVARRRMLIWDTYSGLASRENGIDQPVGGGLMDEPPVLQIQKAIINAEKGAEKQLTVIIKNVLAGPSGMPSQDLPQKALNYWATHDLIFKNEHLVVVFTPSKDFVDARILDKCILIQPPLSLPDERSRELEKLVTQLRINLTPDQKQELMVLTGGLDLNQTQAVFIECLTDFAVSKKMDVGLVSKTKADAINKSSVLRVMKDLSFGFEGVGGYEVVKNYIKNTLILPLKEPVRAKELGVERPRGAIIFGPGGTGKTILAKACAKELSYPFVQLSPENFMSSYVGESERNLAKAIRIIEDMAPCLVFIDEIDRLGGRGESTENDGGTSRRTFSQMLEWLGDDKRQAVVIGATNMPYMDVAFRREGRFDVMIPMLSPDVDARREILNIHLNVRRKVAHKIAKKCIEQVANETDGWKGNMLEELVKRSVRQAFIRGADVVTDKDLLDAKNDYVVNKQALTKDEQKYLDMAKDLCNSKSFLAELIAVGKGITGRDAVLKGKGLIAPP